jgi:oligoendopeptidase F
LLISEEKSLNMIAKTPAPAWHEKAARPSPAYPRRFVPQGLDLGDWEAQKPLWEDLKTRDLPDLAALERWIADWNELSDAIGEESARRYIDMTCDTQDKRAEEAHMHFVEKIDPELAPIGDALNRKLMAHPDVSKLPKEQEKWLASVRTGIELFREENIPLYTELAKLSNEYQKITGAQTVEWEGQTKTLSQLSPVLQEPDRARREKAWRLIAGRRLQDRDALDALFDQMRALRERIAKNAGLDFIEYTFKGNLRDYTPRDCFKFHDAVEKAAVPAYRAALEEHRKALGLGKLRPWDLSCDSLGREPLKPFKTSEELIRGVGTIFGKLDPELKKLYDVMLDHGLMDLDNRVGKAPGGYQSSLTEVRLPFIFMNSVGVNQDVFTLLHESGHAFHYLLARDERVPFNRQSCMEFCEVASMSMERLGARHLDVFYNEEDRKRSIRVEDEEVFRILPWVATVDAFQHWIYAGDHTPAQRMEKWLELDARFGPDVDWSGLEEFRAHSWHRQLHIFEYPFYYIEYGIAQLGALQVWKRSLDNPAEALALYKKALSLGGTRGLAELFAAAGGRFDMGEETIRPLIEAVQREWAAAV